MSSGRGGQRDGAGRKSAWRNGETQTIRVPKVLADQILEIAKRLDSGEVIEFVSESKEKPKRKRDSVTKSESIPNDYVTNSESQLQPLSCRALARRLGVSDTAIMAHRDGKVPPGISEWTQSKDPTGVAWEYQPETKKYFPS
jgi:hypothetical protein